MSIKIVTDPQIEETENYKIEMSRSLYEADFIPRSGDPCGPIGNGYIPESETVEEGINKIKTALESAKRFWIAGADNTYICINKRDVEEMIRELNVIAELATLHP
ncbi:hypothetical protein [Eubacterium callanderi]|uniref:hypothetical protein n=1 Tax=Eubacterium callanderi TaxID=53442 RepID=UPI0022E98250|nr:hypothetical protein [Eubacterium callanderi]